MRIRGKREASRKSAVDHQRTAVADRFDRLCVTAKACVRAIRTLYADLADIGGVMSVINSVDRHPSWRICCQPRPGVDLMTHELARGAGADRSFEPPAEAERELR